MDDSPRTCGLVATFGGEALEGFRVHRAKGFRVQRLRV